MKAAAPVGEAEGAAVGSPPYSELCPLAPYVRLPTIENVIRPPFTVTKPGEGLGVGDGVGVVASGEGAIPFFKGEKLTIGPGVKVGVGVGDGAAVGAAGAVAAGTGVPGTDEGMGVSSADAAGAGLAVGLGAI